MMGRLEAKFDPKFSRDLKRLERKNVDPFALEHVINLILSNTLSARQELVRRHNMHRLAGQWAGSNECHVCNAGDWLLVWAVRDNLAVFQRTGTHREIFR